MISISLISMTPEMMERLTHAEHGNCGGRRGERGWSIGLAIAAIAGGIAAALAIAL